MNIISTSEVFRTKDYDAFSFRGDNRTITTNIKLKQEILKHGILVPVLTNEKFEIVDGQHRWSVARELDIEIPFIVIEGAGKEEIIAINTTSQNWSNEDYIKSYAETGDEEYQKLFNLLREQRTFAGLLCALAQDTPHQSHAINKMKAGNFKFKNYDFLVGFFDFYESLIEETTLQHSGSLQSALYILYRLKKFSPERIFDKSAIISKRIRGIKKHSVLLEILLECYNQNRATRFLISA